MREATFKRESNFSINYGFQSPPPMREATEMSYRDYTDSAISIPASHAGGDFICAFCNACNVVISIPASHAGGDKLPMKTETWTWYFNPRLPCGRRRESDSYNFQAYQFQSPPPMREATATYCVAHYIFTRYSQIS